MVVNFKKIFDWSINSVSEPVYVWNGANYTGYQVVVAYKHHGTKKKFFYLMDKKYNFGRWGNAGFVASEYAQKMKQKQKDRDKIR